MSELIPVGHSAVGTQVPELVSRAKPVLHTVAAAAEHWRALASVQQVGEVSPRKDPPAPGQVARQVGAVAERNVPPVQAVVQVPVPAVAVAPVLAVKK